MTLGEAKKKIMDLVSTRDHSAGELRQKLFGRFETPIVEQAVNWAQQQNWFSSPEKLKNDITEKLNYRSQSIVKINKKLKELGLETATSTAEAEYEKAKKLALKKWSVSVFDGLDLIQAQKLKATIIRFLSARGFDSDIVFSILKNELKAGDLSHDEEY